MNCVDYFFGNTSGFEKDLLLGSQEPISYQSVYEKVLSLAYFLNQDIGTGKNILLVSQNSSFFIIAYLGILKSGNICIPLNPTIEQSNFDYIVNRTKSEIGFISDLARKK